MIIVGPNHRIPVRIGEVTVWVGTMSLAQKSELHSLFKLAGGAEHVDGNKLSMLTIKFAVKELEGVVHPNGEKYELEFEKDGTQLTDECAEMLMGMGDDGKMILAVGKLSREIKAHVIEGVEIDLAKSKVVKKKQETPEASPT